MMLSFFVAMQYRLRNLNRWSLMRTVEKENVAEHSHSVTLIAHMLVTIGKETFGKDNLPSADTVAAAACLHDGSEVFLSDLPKIVKYSSKEMLEQCKKLERMAEDRLINMLPVPLRDTYSKLMRMDDPVVKKYVKAADLLDSYIKCLRELHYGNREYADAKLQTYDELCSLQMEEVNYFIEVFVPAMNKTIDEASAFYLDVKEAQHC